MKVLQFQTLATVDIGLTCCDEIAACKGPDGRPRIAVHRGKEVWFARQRENGTWFTALVGKASTDGGANSMPVVDVYAISITSSAVADVVGWRNRTKDGGDAMQKWHGPCICIIPQNDVPGEARFYNFTEGAVRVIFDGPDASTVELWSKDGAWVRVNVNTGIIVASGKDNIGKTGEKLAVWKGGWRAMGGCASFDNSRVMLRGGSPVDVISGDTYPAIGDDMLYPGFGVRLNTAYFSTVIGGRMLVNVVKDGMARYLISALPSIGDADHVTRHNTPLLPSKARMAAFWTKGGQVMGVDIEAALKGKRAAQALCPGSRAAGYATPPGVVLAVLQGGAAKLVTVRTSKVTA